MSIIVSQLAKTNQQKPKILPNEDPADYFQRLRIWRRKNRPKKKRRPPTPTTAAMRWLKELMFPHVYGEKIGADVIPSIKKEAFVELYNQKGCGYSMANWRYSDHFSGICTYYYWCSPNIAAEFALLMIDIDVLKSKMLGTPQGARKFAEYLKQYFPGIYFEPSTGGKGQHGYLLVKKRGRSAEQVKEALKHLEKWLRLQSKGFDIECVEVKGGPPIIEWTGGRKIECITYGSFAKLPRDATRFAEWEATATVALEDLLELPVVEEEKKSVETPKIPRKRENLNVGSVSGRNISQEELDLMPAWEKFFAKATNKPSHAGRWRITTEDFAQAVVMLRYFAENRNNDGSLPQHRVEELWKALYKAGDFSRAWNHHRWRHLRDWMSNMGWLDWQDNRYQPGTGRGDGVACKLTLDDEFLLQLEDLALHCNKEGGASFMDTVVPRRGSGQALKPVRHFFQGVFERIDWLEVEKAMNSMYAA